MKINPHAAIVPFIGILDCEEGHIDDKFDIQRHDQYNYFVIGEF